jgi:hypothetical protein
MITITAEEYVRLFEEQLNQKLDNQQIEKINKEEKTKELYEYLGRR